MAKRKRFLTEEEILQMLNASDSELSGLSDDDNDVLDKSYEPKVLEGESSSDEQDENDKNICNENVTVDGPSSSKACKSIPQISDFKAASVKVKGKKKEKKKYEWHVKKFLPIPHPGPLDFSQLQVPDPVRNPVDYFTQYFPDNFLQAAADFTNQYSITKTGKSLKTDARELKVFFAANLIMGCISFPRLRMYWQAKYKYPPISDIISRDKFLALRNSFHVVDINTPPANAHENKLWKVQPILDSFRKVCLSLPRDHLTYSIDEQIIPFTGRCPVRQFVKNKPRPVGLKNFVLCTSTGLVLDFVIYQGQSTSLVHPELGLGPSVILKLVETLPKNSFVYFDRYFNTLPLLEKLNELQIFATGTILANRISGLEKGNVENMNRGTCIEQVTKDNKIVIVEWMDSKKVTMASNCCGSEPKENVTRWSKSDRKYIEVPCPSAVKTYNQCMGGVDICDQQMECYRTWFKTRKWTWKVCLHFLDLAVTNAWFQYIRDAKSNAVPKKNQKDLLNFKLEIAESLLAAPSTNRKILSDEENDDVDDFRPFKRSRYYNPPAKKPCEDKRYDRIDHFPLVDDISRPRKCRFEKCESNSKTRCEKCNVYLCLSKKKTCFKDFHCK